MTRSLTTSVESWPIRGEFRIARGAKREANVVVAEIFAGEYTGRGECVPYARYGETVESVVAMIGSLRAVLLGLTRETLLSRLPAGAARNALDCALLDLEAKKSGMPAWRLLGLAEPRAVATAFTLSLDAPAAMANAAAEAAERGYRLLKLKVAGEGDIERVTAVRAAAPDARLIVDANEGWTMEELVRFAPVLAAQGVSLIEQPLKQGADEALADYQSPVPLCADESCHTSADLAFLHGRYSHVNVKLDKAGGLTEAVRLARAAEAMGLKLMIGCMVSTSLAIAPASLLAPLADVVDLDGPLLLARDRDPGLIYEADMLLPPEPAVWG